MDPLNVFFRFVIGRRAPLQIFCPPSIKTWNAPLLLLPHLPPIPHPHPAFPGMYTIYNPYVIGAVSTMGGLLFGLDISSVSAFLAIDSYQDYFNHPSDIVQGGITAGVYFIGSLLCC